MLSLKAFGYYSLAVVAASALAQLATPVVNAFYPRFIQLTARREENELTAMYHQSAQLVTALMGSAAVVLSVFGDRVLLLWTADPDIVRHVSPLLAVMAVGTFLNGVMSIPYYLQLAHGWTSLTLNINIVAVALVFPSTIWAAGRFGAIGAAWVWVALNVGYLIFNIYFMHRRVLRREKWRWYLQDVAVPLASALAVALLCRWLYPLDLGRWTEFVLLTTIAACVLVASTVATPVGRRVTFAIITALRPPPKKPAR